VSSKTSGIVIKQREIKMKNNFILLFIIGFSFAIYAQELTQAEKQMIIDSLDSNNIWEDRNSRILIEKHNIVEAIPKLVSKAQNGDCTAIYLRLLQKLGSSNVQSLVHIAINSSNKCYDPIETRYDCSKILIESGDYSAAQYVIDYYNAKASKFFFDITLIPKIIDNRPDLIQQAKPIVFDYAQNFRGSPFTRYVANAIIAEKYPNEAAQVLVNSFRNEPDDATRILSLWLLFVIDYPGLPELMKERLSQEPIPSYRYIIADSLLKEFGTIENYQYINNYLSSEQDTVTRSLVNHKLETFIPIKPDSNQTIQLLIENLISIIDNCFNYNWLRDSQFKNELQSLIQSAKSNLQAGDSVACAVQVKVFQDLVDYVYKDSLNADPRFVTIEGWKFLYWNAQYILDRLPTPPFVTEQELNEITPAMSMKNQPGAFTMELTGSGFSSSSVVYFNGNARATSYVSDNTITAVILATDVTTVGNFPVWVSDGTTNSDTLVFKVVNNLPKEILPIMNCVTNNGNGTYTAYFGYNNKNSVSVFVPIYSQNKMSPDPWDRGQPGVFKVGIQERVFSVTWTSGNIIWHLNNKIATAKKTSPPCP
jgi:hypothetical protein